MCFRSNVWNIGAEGQFVMGAIAASGVALMADKTRGLDRAGAAAGWGAGGMAWAGLTALLRDRFNANEILVSLMLVYVAVQVLIYLVFGPGKTPWLQLSADQDLREWSRRSRASWRARACTWVLLALALVGVALWVFLFRTRAGFCPAGGRPGPRCCARYAGFSSRQGAVDGAAGVGRSAGLGGALEVARPIGQLTPLRARGLWFCRHHRGLCGAPAPGGHGVFGLLMSMFYIGGELAQSRLGLPKSLTGVFQGLLLFTLLACDAGLPTAALGALPTAKGRC